MPSSSNFAEMDDVSGTCIKYSTSTDRDAFEVAALDGEESYENGRSPDCDGRSIVYTLQGFDQDAQHWTITALRSTGDEQVELIINLFFVTYSASMIISSSRHAASKASARI